MANNLAGNGTETKLIVLTDTNIEAITAENFTF